MIESDDRAAEIFHAAIQFSDREGRAAFVGRECQDDVALEARVLRLIEAHEATNDVPAPLPVRRRSRRSWRG